MILYVLLLLASSLSACSQRQSFWIQSNTSIGENETLCGVKWRDILSIDTLRMAQPANQNWVVASHQYITAKLNQYSDANASQSVKEALLSVGDSLERACDNIREYRISYDHLEILRLYYYSNLCNTTTPYDNSTVKEINPLYYLYTSDILVIPANISLESNKTWRFSLLNDEYRFRQFSVGSAIIGCLSSLILMIVVLVLYDRRKKYYASKKKPKKKKATNTAFDVV